eukprot:5101180-Prorocentrum_lima.AAC.1
MTSSLVGSEMCIRDRVVTCRKVFGNTILTPQQMKEAGASKAWKAQLTMAVSYTHLTLPTICSV